MTFLEVTWTDEETGHRGYVVIDRLVHGSASGGLRMRAGCTLEEVRDLARGMSLKEAITYRPGDAYRPFGGAKGGIDCSPHDPAARAVLSRFLVAVRPLLERYWSTGEDLGVRQEVLDQIAAEIGLRSTVEAALGRLTDPAAGLGRLRTAFGVRVDGVGLADLVGGFGVAEAARAAARRLGLTGRLRAVVQGFGSMGGAAARYLAAGGIAVVGIADADGLVWHPDGLDVEHLLRHRDGFGRVDRTRLRPGEVCRPGADWLDVPAEILVPAAVSYVLTGSTAPRVRAALVVEAANAPTTAEADLSLHARGVTVLPDFVANLGANAWWWWTLFGDVAPTRASAFGKISTTVRRLVAEVLDRSIVDGVPPRVAGLAIAEARAAQLPAS